MKKIEISLLLIVIIQIVLLMNLVPAQSYLINEITPETSKIKKDKLSLIKSGLNLLKILLSIKQIGTVSAFFGDDDSDGNGNGDDPEPIYYCCPETNEGAHCIDLSSPFYGDCAKELQLGTCSQNNCMSCCPENTQGELCQDIPTVHPEQCALNLVPGVCGENCLACCPKIISKDDSNRDDFCIDSSMYHKNCEKSLIYGTCQENNCQIVGLTEPYATFGEDYLLSTVGYSLSLNCCPLTKEGAICQNIIMEDAENCEVFPLPTICDDTSICDVGCCIDEEEGLCTTKATKEKCETGGGTWEDEENCLVPKCQRGCCVLGNNVKFVPDMECVKLSLSGGFEKDFRNLETEIECLALVADIATESCFGDNCTTPEKKDCIDSEGRVRKDGESWCSYEGYIGEGKDTVGSRHWKQSCVDGEIKDEGCADYRGQICVQSEIEEGDLKFSTAACIMNTALQCITYNEEREDMIDLCEEDKACMVQNVNVDSGFKFDICVGRYPRGLDLKGGAASSSKQICSLGSQTCTVVYVKDWKGRWQCQQNCNCRTRTFTEQMNGLCVSLGDCGSYVNYIGEGTDNIRVSNAPGISWEDYEDYADVVEGQFAEPPDMSKYLNSISGTAEGPINLEEETGLQKNVRYLGHIIGGAGILVKGAAALNFLYLAPEAGIGEIFFSNTPFAFTSGSLGAFAGAASGAAIGGMIGVYLAKSLGRTGNAVIAMAIAGAVAGAIIGYAYVTSTALYAAGALTATGWGVVIAIIIMIYIAIIGWGSSMQVKVDFECLPWQAPIGGSDCEICHEDSTKPCTEYKCSSLGQACELLNENEEHPICKSIVYEPNPPVISTGEMLTEGYEFLNEQTKKVEIRKNNGECVQEFTPILFTLKTDEFSQCKYSFEKTSTYEEMTEYGLEQTLSVDNHTFEFRMPSLSHLNVYNVSGDLKESFGNLNMYVRCQDYHGNFNIEEYVVNFCINSEPDITAVANSQTTMIPESGTFLKYGTTQQNLTMLINEPAECKYDIIPGIDYDAMPNSMECNWISGEEDEWLCLTNLNVVDGENKFYIKCKDKPWFDYLETDEERDKYKDRNTNLGDFIYFLYVVERPLTIDYILPTGIKEYGFEPISIELEVKTSGGAENGLSTCFYDWAGNWVLFKESYLGVSKQPGLNLMDGNFDIPIKCEDIAGNVANGSAVFSVTKDSEPPVAVRVFYEVGELKLITNEEAKCYYDLNSCDFDLVNGSSMSLSFSTEHSVEWSVGQTHYIKCKDIWGNENPTCAIKAKLSG